MVGASARAEPAAEGRTVVILAASSAATLAKRVRAEAAAVGIMPIDDPSAGMEEAPALVCRRNRAAGVIRVWSEIRISIDLHARGDTPALFEVIEASADERDSLALRVVEEVRSRLVATALAAPNPPAGQQPTYPLAQPAQGSAPPARPRQEPPQEPPSAPETAATASQPAPASSREDPGARPADGATDARGGLTLGLAGGLTGGLSPGGLGPSLAATVALAARADSGLGVAIRGAFPLATRDLTERGGAVRWRPWLATIEASAEPWRRPRWAVTLGAEVGAALVDLDPTADEDHVANPERLAIAVFQLGAGIRAQVRQGLALRAAVSIGMAAPRPVVRVDGREVASWGRPFVMLSLSTELRLLALGRRGPGS